MSEKYRIYRYTNILNGMKYHGKTCQKYQSNRAGKNGEKYIKCCTAFGDAIREFGWANFKYEVLEDGLTKEEADIRERYWIKKENSIWPNGYNLENGGDKGFHHHDATKRRGSTSMKRNGDWSYLNKPVYRISLDGVILQEYPSATEAGKRTGINHSSISEVCRGKTNRKTAGKYYWRYVECM